MRQLTLTFGSAIVTLRRFITYDRTVADTGQTEYSIAGTPLDSGPVYEPKLIWTIGAMVTWEDWYTLGVVFRESDRTRRQQGNYRITIDDSVENFIEATKTRALVPGGVQVSFPGGVAYPARFYARMFEPQSQWQRNTQYPYIATFTLRELGDISPT